MFTRFFKKKPSPVRLGRWSLTQSNIDSINVKVDQTNHDNCGGPSCTNVPPSVTDVEIPEFLQLRIVPCKHGKNHKK